MQEFTAVYATIREGHVESAQCVRFPAKSLPEAYKQAEAKVVGDAAQLVLVVKGHVEAFREGGLVNTMHGK